MRVLLIDNDDNARLSSRRILERTQTDIEIIESRNAATGIAILQTQGFDVILLDYDLPDMDGSDALRHILHSTQGVPPVIMLSREWDEALAEQCVDAGAYDFIQKNEAAARKLKRAIELAQQQHALEIELRDSHQQLKELSEHDALTGLTNRYGFEVCLRRAYAHAQRQGSYMAVLLLDLDNFKIINETLGHEQGDVLLKIVTQRLLHAIRDEDVLARLGGDEFAVLAQNLAREDLVSHLADRLLSALQRPIDVQDTTLTVTTSIGIATLGDDVHKGEDLLKCADLAMYQAKKDGRNQIRFYSEELHAAVQRRVDLERDLQIALQKQQFCVYYQPQVCMDTGEVIGMEALLRWQHPANGLRMPGEFLDIAEETGLIGPIGDWVLHEACKQLSIWRAKYGKNLKLSVAINLSALQLKGHGLVATVEEALGANGLPTSCLELEITENALITEPEQTAIILHKLAEIGVTLSLDDFGTGYSSLQHLKFFPIQTMKIDRGFLSEIGQDNRHDLLLMAIVKFAQTLGLNIVAEGVETETQLAFCRDLGCNLIQGYYYSAALSAAEFERRFIQDRVIEP